MGFPDDYTLIPWRGGMAPDGPRYKVALALCFQGLRTQARARSATRQRAGETCRSCRHYTLHRMASAYRKCALVKWTRGAATDIRAGDPACLQWEKKAGEVSDA